MVNKGVYFELLSVLYLFSELVPMLQKFSSSIDFTPSDQGYARDVTTALSKTMEVVSNGGRFAEAYIVQRANVNYIRELYALKQNRYDIPYQISGNPDSHPLALMIAGTECENYRQLMYNTIPYTSIVHSLRLAGVSEPGSLMAPDLKWQMGARLDSKLRNKFKDIMDDAAALDGWALNNMKFKDPISNLLWYGHKLNDQSFYSSMVNESDIKKFVRIMGSVNRAKILTLNKSLINVADIYNLLLKYAEAMPGDQVNKLTLFYKKYQAELAHFYSCTSDMKMSTCQLEINLISTKPANMTVRTTDISSNLRVSAEIATVYNYDKKFIGLVSGRRDYQRKVNALNDYMSVYGFNHEEMSADDFYAIARKLTGEAMKSYKIYLNVVSTNRHIIDVISMLDLLSTNTIYNRVVRLNISFAKQRDNIKKMEGLRTPTTVCTYLAYYYACTTLREKGFGDLDIYKNDLNYYIEGRRADIPVEWLPLVYDLSISAELVTPSSINYWCHWVKDQKRVGKIYLGAGELFVHTPEANIKFHIDGNIVYSIDIDRSAQLLEFSQLTSWYISCILDPLLNLRQSLVSTEQYSSQQLVLGKNVAQERWQINYDSFLDGFIPVCRFDMNFAPVWFDLPMSRYFDHGNLFFKCPGHVARIHTIDLEMPINAAVSDMLDYDKFKVQTLNFRNQFRMKLALNFGQRLIIQPTMFFQNATRTKLAKIVNYFEASCSDTERSLMNAFYYYQSLGNDIGLHTPEQCIAIGINKSSLSIPPSLLRFVPILRNIDINPGAKEDLYFQLEAVLDNPVDMEQKLNSLYSIYTMAAVGEALVLALAKDDRIKNSVSAIPPYSLNRDAFITFYKEFFTTFSNFVCSHKFMTPAHVEVRELFHKEPQVSCLAFCLVTCLKRNKFYATHEGSRICDLVVRLFAETVNEAGERFEKYCDGRPYLGSTNFSKWTKNDCEVFMSNVLGSVSSMLGNKLKKTFDKLENLSPYLPQGWLRRAEIDLSKILPQYFFNAKSTKIIFNRETYGGNIRGDLRGPFKYVDRDIGQELQAETMYEPYDDFLDMATSMSAFEETHKHFEKVHKDNYYDLVCPLGDLDTMTLEELALFKKNRAVVATYSTSLPDFMKEIHRNLAFTVYRFTGRAYNPYIKYYYLIFWGIRGAEYSMGHWHPLDYLGVSTRINELYARCTRTVPIAGVEVHKSTMHDPMLSDIFKIRGEFNSTPPAKVQLYSEVEKNISVEYIKESELFKTAVGGETLETIVKRVIASKKEDFKINAISRKKPIKTTFAAFAAQTQSRYMIKDEDKVNVLFDEELRVQLDSISPGLSDRVPKANLVFSQIMADSTLALTQLKYVQTGSKSVSTLYHIMKMILNNSTIVKSTGQPDNVILEDYLDRLNDAFPAPIIDALPCVYDDSASIEMEVSDGVIPTVAEYEAGFRLG